MRGVLGTKLFDAPNLVPVLWSVEPFERRRTAFVFGWKVILDVASRRNDTL